MFAAVVIVTVNAGSSSLKLAAFEVPSLKRSAKASLEEVGEGASVLDRAMDALGDIGTVSAVGHRVVHGGTRFDHAARVTWAMVDELRRISPLDPDHLPPEIGIIEAAQARFANVPHVACFDTAFHRAMPPVAKLLPIPRNLELQRFGFHGLSYTYLMEELARIDPSASKGRVVLAHLGSGASLAAVVNGQPMDTTMGFTPTSGIPMGTRSGDLDPGVLLHLLRTGMGAPALDDLVNRRSGLLGVSETSSDMRDLLTREASDPRAAEAVDLFCHHVKKAVGAMAAVLGGVDTLVFAGGIGERAAPVRARICRGLEHLGVQLDQASNDRDAATISTAASRCTVRVMRTDEESIIARQTFEVMNEASS